MKHILLALILLLIPLSVFGQEPERFGPSREELGLPSTSIATDPWSVQISTGYYNRYVAFGNGDVLYDNPVIQSSITATHTSGVWLSLWNSVGLDGAWNDDAGDEFDYEIGITRQHGWLVWSLVFTYFDQTPVGSGEYNDIYYPHVKLTTHEPFLIFNETLAIKPFIAYDLYITGNDTPYSGGQYGWVGADLSIPITERLEFILTPKIGWDDGGFERTSGFISQLTGNLTYTLNNTLSISAQAKLYQPLTTDDGRDSEIVWGISATASF